MAQKTWSTGDVLTAADQNLYASHEGGAFTAWTPTWTQSGAVTKTVNYATYARASRLIHFQARMTATGAGTGANDVFVGLPVATSASYGADAPIGVAWLYDTSEGLWYPTGPLLWASSTTATIAASSTTVSAHLGSVGFTAAIATGDVVAYSGWYESAA